MVMCYYAVNMVVAVGSSILVFSDGHFMVIQLQVQVIADEWVRMNSTINRIWSFTKETEKRVENLYSDLKKVSFRLSIIDLFHYLKCPRAINDILVLHLIYFLV